MATAEYWETLSDASFSFDGALTRVAEDGGIPARSRGAAWRWLLRDRVDATRKESDEPYAELCQYRDSDAGLEAIEDIDKDVHRTSLLPSGSPHIAELRRILVAYAHRKPDVGYCQGMNFVGAVLLEQLKDEEFAFWALVVILETVLPGHHDQHMIGSHVAQRVLQAQLQVRMPQLHAHLDEIGFSLALVAVPWFVSMYLHALPLPVALRVWDFVLIALRAGLAPSLPILGTALAIFEQASGLLQDADDSSRAISVLRAFVDGLAAEDAAAAGDVSLRAEAFLSHVVNVVRFMDEPELSAQLQRQQEEVAAELRATELTLWNGAVVEFGPGPLGLSIGVQGGRLTVTGFKPLPDGSVGPAQQSGKVSEGAIIHSVNGTVVSGYSPAQLKSLLDAVGRPVSIAFFSDASAYSDEVVPPDSPAYQARLRRHFASTQARRSMPAAHSAATARPAGHAAAMLDDGFSLARLPGEKDFVVTVAARHLAFQATTSVPQCLLRKIPGKLILTSYRLAFHPFRHQQPLPSPTASSGDVAATNPATLDLHVPLGLLLSCALRDGRSLAVRFKHGLSVTLCLDSDATGARVAQVLSAVAFGCPPEHSFAFAHARACEARRAQRKQAKAAEAAAGGDAQSAAAGALPPRTLSTAHADLPNDALPAADASPRPTMPAAAVTASVAATGSDDGGDVTLRAAALVPAPAVRPSLLYGPFPHRFDIRREYERLGLLQSPQWRMLEQPDFLVCDTYPPYLVVPARVNDSDVREIKQFRSRGRIPVAVWVHPETRAVLSRASQPLVGLRSNRCLADERLVTELAWAAGCANETHVIVDARSPLAAKGNRAMGKGTENPALYRGCRQLFMNISNIHAVRDSFTKLADLLQPMGIRGDDDTYLHRVADSQWLRHVRTVIGAAAKIAHLLDREGCSVLVHCSDGWDRASQLPSLAELMLDPYFRTVEGFETLVEKEWCAFGHMFWRRCGMADGGVEDTQRSPIFVLWLDCVYQLMLQFPNAFEFSERYLIALADLSHSARFGNFLFNSPAERVEHKVFESTESVWPYLRARADEWGLLNPGYRPTPGTLLPNCHVRCLRLWEGYFGRWDVDAEGMHLWPTPQFV